LHWLSSAVGQGLFIYLPDIGLVIVEKQMTELICPPAESYPLICRMPRGQNSLCRTEPFP